MAEVKIVLGSKSGKTYQSNVESTSLINKKIGEKISNIEGFSGYEFEITGGSDKDGFPMRKDLGGTGRRKILLAGGPGVNIKIDGMKRRKTIRGNTINEDTAQVNLKVLKEGKKSLKERFGKEEKPAETPKEETKPVEEKPKKEVKESPKVVEKPKEEVKVEEKKEEIKQEA